MVQVTRGMTTQQVMALLGPPSDRMSLDDFLGGYPGGTARMRTAGQRAPQRVYWMYDGVPDRRTTLLIEFVDDRAATIEKRPTAGGPAPAEPRSRVRWWPFGRRR